MQDFFISYNSADLLWAQGIGDWLDHDGYTTVIQATDFVAGSNFVSKMHTALQTGRRLIMVLSPDYLAAKFPEAEWTAAFAKDPTGLTSTLIPVRVRECSPDGLLKPIVYIDLVGLNAEEAKVKLLKEIRALLDGKRTHDDAIPPSAPEKRKRAKLSQKVKGDHNTSIQAGQISNLTIKMTGKKAPVIQPPDVVGANVEMRSYLEYLIDDRYIDWRKWGSAEESINDLFTRQ